jgi:hypothetical protein
VTDDLRRDSGFVEYVQHIRDMMAYTSKHRKGIVGLLDRVFVTMKKGDDEMRHIEESWYKTGARRYEGFERDDEYAREFFKLNLKYDFFINPNLTDADLQVIINDARTRIVRLYADSYQRFLKGFQILQKIQANSEILQLEMEQKLAQEGQQQPQQNPNQPPEKERSATDNIKWDSTNLRDEKITADTVQKILSDKSSEISTIFIDTTRKIYEKGQSTTDDKLKISSLFYLKRMNAIAKPYLDKDRFDRETTDNIKFQLSSLNNQYEGSINQGKSDGLQQQQPSIFQQTVYG